MSIAFVDLKAQFQALEENIRDRINNVLEHGKFIMGPEVQELEQQLAEYTGARHVISCSSGTDALLIALIAKGIGPGDAVFTTPFTFIATAEVISLLGATPVFVDIDSRTFNIDSEKLTNAVATIERQGRLAPRGIITVDLFGLPANYDTIKPVAEKHRLFVLEDAAQSFGSIYKGQKAGTLGHVAATSFFPAKPLGCYGDGGAVFTDDNDLAAALNSIRIHGRGKDKYDNVRIGLNARLDTLQAAILLSKLAAFPAELETRQVIAARYTEGLKDVVETPYIPEGLVSAWAQYSILCNSRDELQAALKAKGIPTAIYYTTPLHLQTAFSDICCIAGDFPVAEATAKRIISLPMNPYLSDKQVDYIISAVVEEACD